MKHGECAICFNADARLHRPEVTDLRLAMCPPVCTSSRCREALLEVWLRAYVVRPERDEQ